MTDDTFSFPRWAVEVWRRVDSPRFEVTRWGGRLGCGFAALVRARGRRERRWNEVAAVRRLGRARSASESAPRWSPAHPLSGSFWFGVQLRLGSVLFDTVLTCAAAEVASIAAITYAASLRTVRFQTDDSMVIASGLPRGAYPRGGLCVGRVLLTGCAPTPAVIRHERRHLSQWMRYGLAMPILYWAAGRDARHNWFELDAGLADGGYA